VERGQGVVAFRRSVGTEEEHEGGGLGKGFDTDLHSSRHTRFGRRGPTIHAFVR